MAELTTICQHCDGTGIEPRETSEYPPEPCSVCKVRINASHYHQCAVCGATLVCVCADKRHGDRATGKPRRLLCVACGEIAEGMRELERAEQQAARPGAEALMSESRTLEPQKVLPLEEIEQIVRSQEVVWSNGLGYCQMATLMEALRKAARFPWERKPE